MSAATTGPAQETRLRGLGFGVLPAPPKRDIDTIDDLVAVAAAAPHLRIARLAGTLGLTPVGVAP